MPKMIHICRKIGRNKDIRVSIKMGWTSIGKVLTIFGGDDIINIKVSMNTAFGDGNTKKDTNAEKYKKREFLHPRNERTAEKMTIINASLKETSNYIIQLFYKTGKIYSCTQTKIGKLLSILAFQYAVRDEQLFFEEIYKYAPNCGTFIKDLTFIPKDIYFRDFENGNPDKCSQIEIEEIDKDGDIAIPAEYQTITSLSDRLKRDIERVFLTFGAYPGNSLGELLNPIVNTAIGHDATVNLPIDLSVFSTLRKDDYQLGNKNAILNYIYQY